MPGIVATVAGQPTIPIRPSGVDNRSEFGVNVGFLGRETSVVPGQSVILNEGDLSRGIYVLCSGKIKLSANSKDGRTILK